MRDYTLSEIVGMLEGSQDAGGIARIIEAFWPTIKDALLEYEQRHPERLVPTPSGD